MPRGFWSLPARTWDGFEGMLGAERFGSPRALLAIEPPLTVLSGAAAGDAVTVVLLTGGGDYRVLCSEAGALRGGGGTCMPDARQ